MWGRHCSGWRRRSKVEEHSHGQKQKLQHQGWACGQKGREFGGSRSPICESDLKRGVGKGIGGGVWGGGGMGGGGVL